MPPQLMLIGAGEGQQECRGHSEAHGFDSTRERAPRGRAYGRSYGRSRVSRSGAGGAAVRAAAGRRPSADRPGWRATRTESRDARHRARAAGPGRSAPCPCSANCAGSSLTMGKTHDRAVAREWQPQLIIRPDEAHAGVGVPARERAAAARAGRSHLAPAVRSAPHRRQRLLRRHARPVVVPDRDAGRRHHHRQRGSRERALHPRQRREARIPPVRRQDPADRPRALRSRRRPRRSQAADRRAGHGDGRRPRRRSSRASIDPRSARRAGSRSRSIACSRTATR